MPTLDKGNRPTLAVKARATHIEHKQKQFKGMSSVNANIYNSRQWKRIRQLVLHKQPLCVNCSNNNKYITANTIDHIIPINAGGSIFNLDNLQALCSSCHNSKSARDRGRAR